jgi:tRNA threonylcarbamoyladenosine biosynthesis protein TsaB
MLILTIRTDKPEAEIGLFEESKQLAYIRWTAHRELAESIHQKIQLLLDQSQHQLQDLHGIIIYKGPGSFTGLRIGMTVANTLAQGLTVPVVASSGEDWCDQGLEQTLHGANDYPATIDYGRQPHLTIQKK